MTRILRPPVRALPLRADLVRLVLKLAQDPGGLILGQKTDGWFWAPGRRQLPTAKLGIAPALLVPAVAPSRHRVLACGLIDS